MSSPMAEISDPSAEFERLAEEFYLETRITAPGKDRAPAQGDDGISREERMRMWREWLASRAKGGESPEAMPDSEPGPGGGVHSVDPRCDGCRETGQREEWLETERDAKSWQDDREAARQQQALRDAVGWAKR